MTIYLDQVTRIISPDGEWLDLEFTHPVDDPMPSIIRGERVRVDPAMIPRQHEELVGLLRDLVKAVAPEIAAHVTLVSLTVQEPIATIVCKYPTEGQPHGQFESQFSLAPHGELWESIVLAAEEAADATVTAERHPGDA